VRVNVLQYSCSCGALCGVDLRLADKIREQRISYINDVIVASVDVAANKSSSANHPVMMYQAMTNDRNALT
jgi:hypothetical protein